MIISGSKNHLALQERTICRQAKGTDYVTTTELDSSPLWFVATRTKAKSSLEVETRQDFTDLRPSCVVGLPA